MREALAVVWQAGGTGIADLRQQGNRHSAHPEGLETTTGRHDRGPLSRASRRGRASPALSIAPSAPVIYQQAAIGWGARSIARPYETPVTLLPRI
jgi:hypothetical protein